MNGPEMNMAHGIPEAGSGHLGRAGQDPRAFVGANGVFEMNHGFRMVL